MKKAKEKKEIFAVFFPCHSWAKMHHFGKIKNRYILFFFLTGTFFYCNRPSACDTLSLRATVMFAYASRAIFRNVKMYRPLVARVWAQAKGITLQRPLAIASGSFVGIVTTTSPPSGPQADHYGIPYSLEDLRESMNLAHVYHMNPARWPYATTGMLWRMMALLPDMELAMLMEIDRQHLEYTYALTTRDPARLKRLAPSLLDKQKSSVRELNQFVALFKILNNLHEDFAVGKQSPYVCWKSQKDVRDAVQWLFTTYAPDGFRNNEFYMECYHHIVPKAGDAKRKPV
jgi:hypothetical protein